MVIARTWVILPLIFAPTFLSFSSSFSLQSIEVIAFFLCFFKEKEIIFIVHYYNSIFPGQTKLKGGKCNGQNLFGCCFLGDWRGQGEYKL